MSLDFVNEELTKLALERSLIYQEKYALIKCPYHKGGNESNPSMMINLQDIRYPVGFFYCLTCNSKGKWNDLALDLNLALINKEANVEYLNLLNPKSLNYEIKTNDQGVPWDKLKLWRGISGELIFKIGGRLAFNPKNKKNELILPVHINKKLVGSIECLLEKEEKIPSYRNSEGSWVKSSLFPYDYVLNLIKENSDLPIALVEGPRDALNLIQYGLPALAILGCTNWSSSLLPLIYNLKCKKHYIIMDSDDPGVKASSILEKDLKKVFHNCKNILLEKVKDPAELKKENVDYFLAYEKFFF